MCDSKGVDLVAVQQDESFKTLDQTLQNFIKNLASGFSKLSDLISQENTTTRNTITQEHRDTRDHVTSELQDIQLKSNNEQHRAKFLESLYYPEIHQRQEEISEAHRQTFDWIFDRTGENIRPWNDFVDWLENGDGIYFILGKAGAGKSTLMNYITTDSRMTTSLNVWAHPSQVLTLKFFFWSAGTKLQKSSLGLLRSLLYQILDHQPGIIPELVRPQGIATLDDRIPTWTRKGLESSLKFVIDRISFSLCLFIDGLDEFEEGEEDLLQLISILGSRPAVKICLSSRALQCFINAFEHSAQLRLQDLTRRDIEMYVADRLLHDPRMATLLQENSCRGKQLVDEVVAKAEGVFLWVNLAVKMLLKGVTNKDDWDMMKKRLDLLPTGIESLYIQMWNRLGEDQKLYRQTAAMYFRIVLLEEISLLQFSIATNENLQSSLLDFTSPPPRVEDIITTCEIAKIRVLTRCAGFLEVEHINPPTTHVGYESGRSELGETSSYEDEFDETESASENLNECETDDGEIFENKRPEDEMDKYRLGKNESEEDRFNRGGPPNEAEDDRCLQRLLKQTKLRFIHRTARDFLAETTHGRAILGEDPPPASSPRILLCKSRLGLDRLSPIPCAENLPEAFKQVRDAQTTEVAMIEPLMDIIENYFSSKYSSGFPANSNWFENWASLPRLGRDLAPVKDFLGLAAGCGVYLDMSEGFLRHIQRAGPRLASYLLACVISNDYSGRLELASMLLLHGANPNETFELGNGSSVSSWYRLLYRIEPESTNYTNPYPREALCKIIEAFLNNGADLHEIVQVWYFSGERNSGETTTVRDEVTARYIVTEVLRHEPGFPIIEERFESADAQASRRPLLADRDSPPFIWDCSPYSLFAGPYPTLKG